MKRVLGIALPLLLVSLLAVAGGCGSTGYNTFNLHEGMQPFSFEYPQQYKLVRIDMEDDDTAQYTTIGLETSASSGYSEIYVYLWNTTSDLSTTGEIMDKLLANAGQSLTGFSQQARTDVTIDGLDGQSATFSAAADADQSQPAAVYRVSVCTSGSKAVEIDMTCDPALQDATQADYDNILATFALLS